jgi:hypothetical protein
MDFKNIAELEGYYRENFPYHPFICEKCRGYIFEEKSSCLRTHGMELAKDTILDFFKDYSKKMETYHAALAKKNSKGKSEKMIVKALCQDCYKIIKYPDYDTGIIALCPCGGDMCSFDDCQVTIQELEDGHINVEMFDPAYYATIKDKKLTWNAENGLIVGEASA